MSKEIPFSDLLKSDDANIEHDFVAAGIDGSRLDGTILQMDEVEKSFAQKLDDILSKRKHIKTIPDINEIIKQYKATPPDPIPEGYKEYEVNFRDDPDSAVLLEFFDEVIDEKSKWTFQKKIRKNWRYFTVPQDNFKFYQDWAKYILRNYATYREYFDKFFTHLEAVAEKVKEIIERYHANDIDAFVKNKTMAELGLADFYVPYGKMSDEQLIFQYENIRFFETSVETIVAKYYPFIDHIYLKKLSFEDAEKVMGKSRGSIEHALRKVVDIMAERLIKHSFYKRNTLWALEEIMPTVQTFKKKDLEEMHHASGVLLATLMEKTMCLDRILIEKSQNLRNRKRVEFLR